MLRTGPDGALLIPDRTYPRAFTLQVGGTDQSYVDLDDPTRLEFDYVQRLADIIDQLAPPGDRIRVVHIGGAGLTLPRYVSATRPRSAQVVFEPDTELTDFVRTQLPLPPRSGIKVRPDDGRSGTADLRDGYADVVVIDAFVGARVPADLTTVEFFTDVRRVVGEAGVVLVNLTDRGPFDYARRVSAGLLEAMPHAVFCAEPATLKGRRFGNIILAGSDRALPAAEIAERAGRSPFPYRVLHGPRLAQLIAGVSGFRDGSGERSPEPPAGMAFFA